MNDVARSKDVYAVLGLMCIDPKFRDAFFRKPAKTASALIGSLSPDEVRQLNGLAGASAGSDAQREAYILALRDRLNGVRMALGCPHFPCPDADPYTETVVDQQEEEEDPLET